MSCPLSFSVSRWVPCSASRSRNRACSSRARSLARCNCALSSWSTFFLTAVITGLIVLAALNGVWGVKMYPKALVWQADIVGGLLLGAGISIAGACPGTVFAQIGAGYRDAWFTVAGGILGAMTFGYLEPALRPILLSGGPGKLTLDQLAHLPSWALVLGFMAVLVAALMVLERRQAWRDEVGSGVDGLAVPSDRAAKTKTIAPSTLSSAST